VTSNKARETDEGGEYDQLVPQYLHEPVTIKIEKFSAHPLEEDAAEVYHNEEEGYYEVTLDPEDGLYPLPYMARRDDGTPDGTPFESEDTEDPDLDWGGRQFFYPDASRIFEEIDRSIYGRDIDGKANLLGDMAEYDFVRPLPPGGYTSKGEEYGEDFFPYEPQGKAQHPRVRDLAKIINEVQAHIDEGNYDGVMWLEGSPRLEETLYWIQLLLDTDLPIVGHVANRPHSLLSNDGDRNIVNGVEYLVSDESEGNGAVALQDQVIYASREFKKGDARPGAFDAVGGAGGVLGTVSSEVRVHFSPAYDHTSTSSMNISSLPEELTFHDTVDEEVSIHIKDDGELVKEEIPRVSISKGMSYPQVNGTDNPESEVDIMGRVEQALEERENEGRPNLHGLVFEGSSPYGMGSPSQDSALELAAYNGIPVIRVGRSDPGGFVPPHPKKPAAEGSNLDANKAAMLLTAALLKLGRLPRAEDPKNPTEAEREAVMDKMAEYQKIIDQH
jgi:L-asparaginase/Glu-tRNA(Gln) amidotransferase subunit D